MNVAEQLEAKITPLLVRGKYESLDHASGLVYLRAVPVFTYKSRPGCHHRMEYNMKNAAGQWKVVSRKKVIEALG